MFLYLPAIFQGTLFLLALELLAFYNDFFWTLFGAFLIISLVGFRIVVRSWSLGYLLTMFLLSTWTMVHLIDGRTDRHFFIIISTAIYYFLLLGAYRLRKNSKDDTTQGIIATVLMATIFLFFSASYGIYLNFETPVWLLMIFYFINIAVISYQYFTSIGERKKTTVLIYSTILGFAMLEMGWIINFWPFSYLTTGFILFTFYYVLWDLVQNHFLNNLSKKKVFFNLTFFVAISAIVLWSSSWLPKI